MRTMQIEKLNSQDIAKTAKKTAKILQQGKIIIGPSDTVYGLFCDAKNTRAVSRIFEIKKRPKSKPLGVFAKDIQAAKKIANINKQQEQFLKKNWPGKLTAVLKSKIDMPGITLENKIGVRVIDYPLLNHLLEQLNRPIAQTSANISGMPASIKIKQVIAYFEKQKNQPDIILDAGDLPASLPSAVVDLTLEKPKILRIG